MMKRAFAVTLTALAIGLASHNPASAGGKYSDVAGPANTEAHAQTPVGSGRCWWDVPVIGAGVAFFELLRDEEQEYHCPNYSHDYPVDGRTYDRHRRW